MRSTKEESENWQSHQHSEDDPGQMEGCFKLTGTAFVTAVGVADPSGVIIATACTVVRHLISCGLFARRLEDVICIRFRSGCLCEYVHRLHVTTS